MKKKVLLVLVTALCLNFGSCTKVYESVPVYVYALGIESDSNGVKLHVLYKSGNENKSENKSGEEGKESEDENGTQAKIKTFGGKDIEKAVKKMFSEYKNIYTGTIKWYILENDENNKIKDEFIAYTVNSSSLPLKRKIVSRDNVYEYMTEYKAQLCR